MIILAHSSLIPIGFVRGVTTVTLPLQPSDEDR
jgi:hypothetical protein